MFRLMHVFWLGCFVFVVSSVVARADVPGTWHEGIVFLPGSATQSGEMVRLSGVQGNTEEWSKKIHSEHLKDDTKLPAIVYLHGCGGYFALDGWSLPLAGLGIAIFAPNSFARPGREALCGQGGMDFRISMRVEELKYAREELRRISWVDNDKVILMGFSEGSQATSEYDGGAFIAHMPIGTDCRYQNGSPYAEGDVPILNIVGSRDRYGYGEGCSISSDDKGSRSLIIDGGSHDVSGYAEAITAAKDFLEKCCGIKPTAVAFDHEGEADAMISEFGELAPVFAFQKSEDAMNSGDVTGNDNWLKVRDLVYEKLGLPPGG